LGFRKLRAASADSANLHGPLKPRPVKGIQHTRIKDSKQVAPLTSSFLNPLRPAWPEGAATLFSCSSCMWSPSSGRAPRLDEVSVDFPVLDACIICPSTIFNLALGGALLTDCCVLDEDINNMHTQNPRGTAGEPPDLDTDRNTGFWPLYPPPGGILA